MGKINVHITVINTNLFSYVFLIFIYLFFINVKWYTFICETASTFHIFKHSFVLLFLFYGVHEPFWFVILHINIQHTKLLGGCVARWTYSDLMVILGSTRVTYYTSYMFDFNVNISSNVSYQNLSYSYLTISYILLMF